jgi:serine/threonine protein kinase
MKIPDSLRWKADGQTLGSGGQGAVVAVTDKTGEHAGRFALKSLPLDKPAKAYERFAREVEAMKAVAHPNVARLFDHSAPGDAFPFYVMEYIEGARPLKKLVGSAENPFQGDALRSLRFFLQLASAIYAWEQAKIVHRDLSPGNVLILPSGDIKVIDFGICQIDETETITLADEGVGTQNYMAPECESGAGGEVRTWSDIYSAGKLLWTAITNQFAFSREQAAFNAKALSVIFPDNPETWHLQHIFEKTIRHAPSNRVMNAEAAVQLAKRVELVIAGNFPPLEALAKSRCPVCGWGSVKRFEQSHMVFYHAENARIMPVQCDYCGFCFAVNANAVSNRMQAVKSYQ